ncbi:MAG: sel1 repeat family protein, partial [Desulfovibrio sp.]|nr:sel1 repeat family protein [Desulfovibrio sp.]
MKMTMLAAGLLACLLLGGPAGWPAHAGEPTDQGPAIAKALEEFAARAEAFIAQAEAGDTEAQWTLGRLNLINQNYEGALKWFGKAAALGYAPAQTSLGKMHAEGQGVPQDYGIACKWWKKAAEQGDVDAQVFLGMSYAWGRGVPRDPLQASKWLAKGFAGSWAGLLSSDAGKAGMIVILFAGAFFLAVKFRPKARKLSRKQKPVATQAELQCGKTAPAGAGRPKTASKGRNPNGVKDFSFERCGTATEVTPTGAEDFYRLGRMLAKGIGGMARDWSRARNAFGQAARLGHARAQTRFGFMLLEERGSRAFRDAREWLGRAAGQGDPEAMSGLSLMAEHGLGEKADAAGAARLQEEARRLGGRDAMDVFRKRTENWLRIRGMLGIGLKKRFATFLARLDTPARRIGFLTILAGIAMVVSGMIGIVADSRHPEIGVRILLGGGIVLAGAGALGMAGLLDRLWAWVLHGSAKQGEAGTREATGYGLRPRQCRPRGRRAFGRVHSGEDFSHLRAVHEEHWTTLGARPVEGRLYAAGCPPRLQNSHPGLRPSKSCRGRPAAPRSLSARRGFPAASTGTSGRFHWNLPLEFPVEFPIASIAAKPRARLRGVCRPGEGHDDAGQGQSPGRFGQVACTPCPSWPGRRRPRPCRPSMPPLLLSPGPCPFPAVFESGVHGAWRTERATMPGQ